MRARRPEAVAPSPSRSGPRACARARRRARADAGRRARARSLDAPKPAYALPEYTVYGTRLLGPYSVIHLELSTYSTRPRPSSPGSWSSFRGWWCEPTLEERRGSPHEGLAEREIVVLVDGVPISDPYTGASIWRWCSSARRGGPRDQGAGRERVRRERDGRHRRGHDGRADRSGLCYRLSGGSDGRYSGHVSGAGSAGRSASPAAWPPAPLRLRAPRIVRTRPDGKTGARATTPRARTSSCGGGQRGTRRPHRRGALRPDVRRAEGRAGVLERRPPAVLELPLLAGDENRGLVQLAARERVSREPHLLQHERQPACLLCRPREDEEALAHSVANHALGGYVYSELGGVEGHRISAGINVRGDAASSSPTSAPSGASTTPRRRRSSDRTWWPSARATGSRWRSTPTSCPGPAASSRG